MSPDTGPIGNPMSTTATEFPARAPQRLAVSFEFSPPRTDAAEQTLWETVKLFSASEAAAPVQASCKMQRPG